MLLSKLVAPVASVEKESTVTHILLRCDMYKDLENKIFGPLTGRNDFRTILSKAELATKAIRYMEQTQILGQVGIRDVQTTPSTGGRL